MKTRLRAKMVQRRMGMALTAQGRIDSNIMQVPAIRTVRQVAKMGIERGRAGHAPRVAQHVAANLSVCLRQHQAARRAQPAAFIEHVRPFGAAGVHTGSKRHDCGQMVRLHRGP